MSLAPTRRTLLGGALALAACDRSAHSQSPTRLAAPLKAAPFPVGAAVQAAFLDQPDLARLITDQVSQLTPEWEMKMEYIVRDDGSFRFDAPDRIAGFARTHGLRLFGHTLVWYAQNPRAFEQLDETRANFGQAYRNYILAVVGRYRGLAAGWDVVNEAIEEDGQGWRDSLWSQRLGRLDHMVRAFEHAREADPEAVLFLNDYNLESLPKKRASFMKLADALLTAGAPLTGLGTQTHVAADLPAGAITAAIKDLASLGLPIHVSEMDVSLTRAKGPLPNRDEHLAGQKRLYVEAGEAFAALPARQPFAFTHWGLRDSESWLRRENAADAPLLFDDQGRPKAAAQAWVQAVRRAAP